MELSAESLGPHQTYTHLIQASSKAGCRLPQAPVQVPVCDKVHIQELVGASDRHVIATQAQLVHLPSPKDIILYRERQAQVLRLPFIPAMSVYCDVVILGICPFSFAVSSRLHAMHIIGRRSLCIKAGVFWSLFMRLIWRPLFLLYAFC